MDLHWLFRGRLTPPSYRVALLSTPALKRLESEGSAYKVVLITGPAGYGKTALLAQWRVALRAAGTRTAWISVSAEQNDPAQLLTHIAMSLIDAGVVAGHRNRATLRQQPATISDCERRRLGRCPLAHDQRKRNALEMTETELKLMASAAIIGDNSHPVSG
jgi:ATP/maltotriose-dependent transcriptional regulator MalT